MKKQEVFVPEEYEFLLQFAGKIQDNSAVRRL
jgi:hypothetical protein